MHQERSYYIMVKGTVEEQLLNTSSPSCMRVVQAGENKTQLVTRTDQAGLIGLIRFLHGQGFLLLSITQKAGTSGIE
ncbi:MAG: hypothetical protein JXA25_09070 [Anaerolineales bacterium]|nr:hypothetical protein [Anaerolineales bacterium]